MLFFSLSDHLFAGGNWLFRPHVALTERAWVLCQDTPGPFCSSKPHEWPPDTFVYCDPISCVTHCKTLFGIMARKTQHGRGGHGKPVLCSKSMSFSVFRKGGCDGFGIKVLVALTSVTFQCRENKAWCSPAGIKSSGYIRRMMTRSKCSGTFWDTCRLGHICFSFFFLLFLYVKCIMFKINQV